MKMKLVYKLCLMELKLIFSNLRKKIFNLIIIIILMISFITIVKDKLEDRLTILISNEDESPLVNSLLTNNELNKLGNLSSVKLEEGIEKLSKGRGSFLINIKKDSLKRLYEGNDISIDVYGDLRSAFSKDIIEYISSYTDILNVSENAGLNYLFRLDSKERQKEFNLLQLKYLGIIFRKNTIIGKKDYSVILNSLPVIILLAFNLVMIRIYRLKQIDKRLIVSGYKKIELIFARVLIVASLNVVLTIVLMVGKRCILSQF